MLDFYKNSTADYSQRAFRDSQEENLAGVLDRLEQTMAKNPAESIIPPGRDPGTELVGGSGLCRHDLPAAG